VAHVNKELKKRSKLWANKGCNKTQSIQTDLVRLRNDDVLTLSQNHDISFDNRDDWREERIPPRPNVHSVSIQCDGESLFHSTLNETLLDDSKEISRDANVTERNEVDKSQVKIVVFGVIYIVRNGLLGLY
jgi:hypothetical protein